MAGIFTMTLLLSRQSKKAQQMHPELRRFQPELFVAAALWILPLTRCVDWVSADELPAKSPQPVDVAAVIEPFLKDKPYVGVTVGVVSPAEHSFHAFGQVQRESLSQPPREDTIFEIGSITKSFTGTLLALLASEGRVQLDDPANKYLKPEWQLPSAEARAVTLAELATHTSGLPVQPPLIGFFALATGVPDNPYSKFDGDALQKTMSSLKLSHPIGQDYEYSNLGVGLLGHSLVTAAQAGSYEELLRDRLLKPLELRDTSIALSDDQKNRFAQPHKLNGDPTPAWDFATLEACGGLRSTTSDMIRWIEAHLGRFDTPLKPALRMSHQVRFPSEPGHNKRDVQLGLCWHWIPITGRPERAVFHNGGTYGSRSFVAFVPSKNVGVVLLSNSGHSVDEVGVTLLQRLLDRFAPIAKPNSR